MVKKLSIAVVLFMMGFGLTFAQDKGRVDVTLDVEMNIAQVNKVTWSDVDERSPIANFNNFTHSNFGPLDGNWFTKESTILFSYEQERFGGSLRFNPQNWGIPPWKTWLMLGPMFRITAGNDIESLYADPQGADPGLRVYNGGAGSNGWNGSLNPDNITQDRGLLLEGFFGAVTAAVAGFVLEPRDKPDFINVEGTSEFLEVTGRNFQFGTRIGSEIGEWGKVNASYFLLYDKRAAGYYEIEGQLFSGSSRTETYTHYFGVYASLTPLENLGVTAGYGGVINKLLDEFWPRQFRTKMETVMPLVLQNGFMLNAKYVDVIPGLMIRTDHNITYWIDKNLNSLGAIPGWDDFGALGKTQHPSAPDVSHLMLWNGLGFGYQLNRAIGLEFYIRNLYRKDSSLEGGVEHTLERNEFFAEPKLVLYITPFARMSFAVAVTNTTVSANEALNYKGRNRFTGGNNLRQQATKDSELVIQVPIGFTMQF